MLNVVAVHKTEGIHGFEQPLWQRIRIRCQADALHAREAARGMARSIGFGLTDSVLLSACVSEVARQMVAQDIPGTIVLLGFDGAFRFEADVASPATPARCLPCIA